MQAVVGWGRAQRAARRSGAVPSRFMLHDLDQPKRYRDLTLSARDFGYHLLVSHWQTFRTLLEDPRGGSTRYHYIFHFYAHSKYLKSLHTWDVCTRNHPCLLYAALCHKITRARGCILKNHLYAKVQIDDSATAILANIYSTHIFQHLSPSPPVTQAEEKP